MIIHGAMENLTTPGDLLRLYTPPKICSPMWMAPLGSGSDFLYGPHRAMNESIVLVTINYRLGPLGFLSGEDCPLNIGLHDQRWAYTALVICVL